MSNITGIYYSHRDVPAISPICREYIDRAAIMAGATIIAVVPSSTNLPPSWRRIDIATGDREIGIFDAYKRILAGCLAAKTEYVALLEHDVIYPESHFDQQSMPRLHDEIGYQQEVYRLAIEGYFRHPNRAGATMVTSNCFARRPVMICEILARINHIRVGGRISWSEPGRSFAGFAATAPTLTFSGDPSADIRHGANLTGDRTPVDGRYFDAVSAHLPTARDFWRRVRGGE